MNENENEADRRLRHLITTAVAPQDAVALSATEFEQLMASSVAQPISPPRHDAIMQKLELLMCDAPAKPRTANRRMSGRALWPRPLPATLGSFPSKLISRFTVAVALLLLAGLVGSAAVILWRLRTNSVARHQESLASTEKGRPDEKAAPASTPVEPTPLRGREIAAVQSTDTSAPPGSAAIVGESIQPVRPGPRTNENSGIPFDPLKENGPIFIDPIEKTPWPTPKLALVITGEQLGYLEPCGCAGLDRMKGGMSRRYSLFRMLREKGWPLVGMDVGGTAKGFGKQAEIKFQIAVNSLLAMRYNSAALGLSDLQLPTEEVLSQTMPPNAKAKTMFVCGNVGLFSFNEAMLPRTQLISTGYKMIGVTAIVGNQYLQALATNTDLKQMPAEAVLNAAVPLLKNRAEYMVLLAHATKAEAIALSKKYPDFNLVVCAGEPGITGAEPPATAEEIKESGAKLIEVGEKGMYAVVIGLYDDPKQPMRYQRVTLDSRFPSSPEMVALMTAYQEQLKEMGLSGLGIRPLPHPQKQTSGKYVGSEACATCHEESYRVWKKTPHSHAFATLKTAKPPRDFDPECISCHTVGWNTQKFFPYESGYLSEKETPHLTNVGCEDCHGPGEKHVEAENHGTAAEQVAARKTVVLTEEEASNPNSPKQNCWTCHDLDNSPEFKFNLYFPFVKHYERE